MSIMKRFRPSQDSICSHLHCVETPCSIPCAHCSRMFCFRHLFEHQIAIDDQQKRTRSAIELCRKRLKSIEFVDCRSNLIEQIHRWTNEIIEKGEKLKNEIDRIFDETREEFHSIKTNLFNDHQQRSTSEFQRSLFALESARLNLILPTINDDSLRLIKPQFNSSLYSQSPSIDSTDLIRHISTSELIFNVDFDPIDVKLYSTSTEFLVLFRSSRSIFQFYNRTGEHLFDIHYDHQTNGDLNQFVWSSHENLFLLATTKQFFKLNSSTRRLTRSTDIGYGFFKDLCVVGESIVVVHHLGTSLGDVIEHYSNHRFLQRCWKSDLYPDEIKVKTTMEIFRIRMSSHLIAIDALFTEKILICDVSQAMKCLFRIEMNQLNISSISSIYDAKQWFIFGEDENSVEHVFLLDGRTGEKTSIKFVGLSPNNLNFFGENQLILTRRDVKDEENLLFECRKMHSIAENKNQIFF